MKANELRIGNLFKDREGRICKVESINEYFEDCDILSIEGAITALPVEQIPLTEEWIVKFGFDKRMFGYWSETIYLRRDENKDFFWFDWDGTNESKGTHLACVHTLQNLYFALTGEELTLSE